jgi:hypothetical protein
LIALFTDIVMKLSFIFLSTLFIGFVFISMFVLYFYFYILSLRRVIRNVSHYFCSIAEK